MRYQKQIAQIGENGQERLKEGKVLVVGVGGLGCPALMQLVASGVGKIGMVDGDIVELSNLSRQLLFTQEDIGEKKVDVAAHRLKQMNPEIVIEVFPFFLNETNSEILRKFDIVIDGTDRPEPRYEISKKCEEWGLAHVYGAVEGMQGQLAVFNVLNAEKQTYSYRDLFSDPSPTACSCEEAGVLGVVPTSIGTLQALESIKLLLGELSSLQSHLLLIDFNECTQQLIGLSPTSLGRGFALQPAFPKLVSYEELQGLLCSSDPPLLIDVRNRSEPESGHIGGLWIPLHELKENVSSFHEDQSIVFYCKSGIRSRQAAQIVRETVPKIKLYCLKQ